MRDLFSFRPSFYFHRRVNRFDKYLTNYCIINEQIESRTKQYLTRVSNSCINSKESCAINIQSQEEVVRKIPVSALKLIFKSCNKLCTSYIKHRVTVIPSNKS